VSTTLKGDAFEKRVFDALSLALKTYRLGLLPSASEIFRKKPYHSRDRGTDIVVDIAIEVTLPRAATWSLLWVWECKDYDSALPVSDLEEFWAKLEQIGGVNIKGGIACSNVVARGALAFARSKGIALVRLLPKERVKWELHHPARTPETNDIDRALFEPDFRPLNRDFYGIEADRVFDDWTSLIGTTIESHHIADREGNDDSL
jgi:hypothetical protein